MKIIDADYVKNTIPDIDNVVRIAKGGQKLVFRAVHVTYGEVAVKFVADIDDVRIKREIEILTEIKLVNVPRLYKWDIIDIGSDKFLYMVEEFINGQPLRDLINKSPVLPLKLSLHILESLLETTAELEKLNLVHRDIKPENLIIGNNRIVYLLDFGIARDLSKSSITYTHQPYGPHTPGYSAPEQFRNMKKEIDSRCDLFSIGVVVYEILKGKHPFVDGSSGHPIDILNRTETVTPDPLIIKGDTQKQLAAFINILMDKLPSRRPKNAETALKWFKALLPTINIDGK